MKPLKIGCWLGLFWTSIVIAVSVIPYSRIRYPEIKSTAPSRFMWSYSLWHFQHRYENYLRNPTRSVIVGSSYAAMIGNARGISNLAGLAWDAPEINSFVLADLGNRNVIYPLTVREYASVGLPPRLSAVYSLPRKAEICGDIVSLLIGIRDYREYGRFEVSPDEQDIFDKARLFDSATFNPSLASLQLKYSFRISNLSSEERIAEFRNLARKHGNIIFILHPFLPLKEVPETNEFATKINQVISLNGDMKSLFENSGLSILDLSEKYLPYLKDLDHLTFEGSTLMRDEIRRSLKCEQ